MRWLVFLVLIGACGGQGTLDAPVEAVEPAPSSAPGDTDGGAGADTNAPFEASAEPQPPVTAWARYTIEPGAHTATLTTAAAGNPRDGLVSGLGARDYDLALDASAAYVLTAPAQPDDQLDWNKLPGLSDCGSFDLAADGVMFGWRYRPDTSPARVEITAYANDSGSHLTPPEPLVSLDAADLASATPLRYRLRMDGAVYRFAISGVVRSRAIDVEAALPRRCADTAPGSLAAQWAAGFYFGGTSTSPSTITAAIFDHL
jgi:hypothetical protein